MRRLPLRELPLDRPADGATLRSGDRAGAGSTGAGLLTNPSVPCVRRRLGGSEEQSAEVEKGHAHLRLSRINLRCLPQSNASPHSPISPLVDLGRPCMLMIPRASDVPPVLRGHTLSQQQWGAMCQSNLTYWHVGALSHMPDRSLVFGVETRACRAIILRYGMDNTSHFKAEGNCWNVLSSCQTHFAN